MRTKSFSPLTTLTRITSVVIILVFCLQHGLMAQTTRYVKPTASGLGNGSSWANASNDLQAMINASAANDLVFVASGTYKPQRPANNLGVIAANNRDNAFVLRTSVKVYGGFAGTETALTQRVLNSAAPSILSGDIGTTGANFDNCYHVVISSGNVINAILDGFTITGGNANGGGTISVNGFNLNQASGGGMFCYASGPFLTNLNVNGNNASFAGGIIFSGASSAKLTNACISGNTVTNWGGGLSFYSSDCVLTNVTIAGNYSATSAGAIYNSGALLQIRNSIIWGNSSGTNVLGGMTITYSLMQGVPASVPNNVLDGATDPLFVNAVAPSATPTTAGDYRLQPTSPCINKGNNVVFNTGQNPDLSSITSDVSGMPRIYGSAIDMGAHEVGCVPGILYVDNNIAASGTGGTWATAFKTLSEALDTANKVDCDMEIWVKAGTYYPTTRTGAPTTIRDSSFRVSRNGIKIYGGFAGNETILTQRDPAANLTILSGDIGALNDSLDNVYSVVTFEAVRSTAADLTYSILDGFTIERGNGNYNYPGSTSIDIRNQAGGIHVKSRAGFTTNVNIYNCVVRRTFGVYGGGISAWANGSTVRTRVNVYHTVFTNNRAAFGGAACPIAFPAGSLCDVNFRNCVFANNAGLGNAILSDGDGAGAVATTVVSNCTFYGHPQAVLYNVQQNGGAGSITSNNSIFWNTTAYTAMVTGTNVSFANCDINTTTPGATNINGNPLFVNANDPDGPDDIWGTADDGLTLLSCSPAMNAGNNALIPAGLTTDMTGSPRIYNTTVDIGAYEFQNLSVSGIVYVDSSIAASGDGRSWATAYKTLSEALLTARHCTNVDTVLVAKGTYYPTGVQSRTNRDSSFVILRGGLKVFGGYPNGGGARNITAYPTIMSGDIGVTNDTLDNSIHVMVIAGVAAAADSIVVDGFTITEGNANVNAAVVYGTATLYQGHGGGIYMIANATGPKTALRNLSFVYNTANVLGGGMEIVNSAPFIQNCAFTNNHALDRGGGIANENQASPYVTGCSFTGNAANVVGGGVYNANASSIPTYINCSFTGNTTGTAGNGWGGGMTNLGSAAIVTKCTFTNNSTLYIGGGMYNQSASPVLDSCVFTGNYAASGGGGMFNLVNCSPTISNSTFNSNTSGGGGSGLHNENNCNPVVRYTVFKGNSGHAGAIRNAGSAPTFLNILITGNRSNWGGAVYNSNSQPVFTNSTIAGNYAVQNGGGVNNANNTVATFNNCIINSNATPGNRATIRNESGGTANYTNCLLTDWLAEYGTDNGGVITGNPLFVNLVTATNASTPNTGGDYSLQPCSPAVNMGSNALVPGTLTTDMAANARIIGTAVDIGAYELQSISNTITFTDVIKTYGDPDAAVPNVTNCSGLPLTFTIGDNTIATIVSGNLHILKAGTTTITATAPNGTPGATVNLIVNPKPVTVSLIAPVEKVYDGNTNATITTANLQLAPGDVVGTDDVAIALSSTVGSYDTKFVGTGKTVTVPLGNISLTGTTAPNYVIANTTNVSAAIGVITPLAITVIADPQTKNYGDADPALTYTFSPALAPGDAFTGSLERAPGENAGIYPINQGTLALNGNYTITYGGDNLIIAPRVITVTADPKTKMYGDADPALTYTYSPALIGTDVLTGSLTRTAGENIGTYPINQGSLALNGNYNIVYNGSNLNITPRTITVTADPKTKAYGDVDPALTYTYAPALIGTDAFTGALARSAGENIGTYPVNQGTLSLGSNYTIVYNGNNLTITPRAITVTADAQTKVYGDADPALTYTVSPALVPGDAFTGALSRVPGENIGAYGINQGTLSAGGNYTVTYNGNNLTITPKAITVTADAQTKVYGDADPALTYTVTPALIAGDAFTGALTRAAGENVGSYPIGQGTLSAGSNYTITYNGNNLAITPRVITVTVDAKTKVYGDTDPALTYTYSPALIGTDAFTGALVRTTGENLGTYPITQGTLALSSNYTVVYNGNNLTITPRVITVTADAKTKVYGDTDPALTYTYSPALIGTDAFSGALARTAGENIGTYPITQGTLTLGGNYTIIYNGNNLNITPRVITVTADVKTKLYGDADPALTYTYSPALIGADAFTGTLTRTAGENVGIYPINQGTLTAGSNYTIIYNGNNLTITPRAITVTADAKTKVYGDADPALTYTYSPALVAGDAFIGSLVRVTGENIGAYPINQGSLALSGNYTITYIGNNLTITPKAITVTADAKTKVYGDADPALTYTYSPALVAGDAFTGSLTRTAGENIGVYPIGQGSLALNSNYAITYVGANLVITPKAITITADAKTKVYGDADPALTYTYSPALVAGDAFTGSLVRVAGENIGTYPINQGTLAINSNYTVTYVGANLTITPKAITITADAKTKVYGDADPALTYTYSPALVAGDAFTGSLVRIAGENVGTYPINQGTLALNGNYTVTYAGANLVITPKAITITADAKAKVYGDVDPALTYTYSPALRAGDAFTGSLVRIAGENVGAYPINQGTLALSSNYTVTYVGADLVINPRVITVTASAQTKVYGDPDPALGITWWPGLVAGDAFTGTIARMPGENAGTYPILQNTLALSSNYQLIYVPADFIITKAVLTVTAQDLIICQNDVLTTVPVNYAGFKNGDNASVLSTEPTVIIPSYPTAGNYVLKPTGGVANNYSFNYVNGQLTVKPSPSGSIAQVQIGPATINSPGITSGVRLTAPTGTNYTWSWSTGAQTQIITVQSSGEFWVDVSNPQGCTTRFTIQVKQQTLIIPNIFSPNGDGINDKWVIQNLENYPGSVIQIYNRYGQAVHKIVNYSSPWDGRINGKDMPIGTYYYIIDPKNGQKPVTGFVDIIR